MSEVSFATLPLAAPLQRALTEKGYTTPSPIQAQAIPVLIEGRDLLACAQTGTGKTAAFALPVLQRLLTQPRKVSRGAMRALVLTPTRELAVQIADSFAAYGAHLQGRMGLVYGGVSQRPQERALAGGLEVLIATPGRLLDLTEQGFVNFSEVEMFILDEADRMLDMGFIHDIRRIAAEIPATRQTMLFSATMPGEIAKLARDLLRNPADIRIAPAATTAEKVEQRLLYVTNENKRPLLQEMLATRHAANRAERTLVFSRTKHGANRLAEQLCKAGLKADAIHGNKSQSARQYALDRFRSGHTPVLVATDVAARGIDVKDVTLVVNFDLPLEPDSYVHRIGRTARAGASGLAVSFCAPDEVGLLRSIERLIRQTVPVDATHAYHVELPAHRAGGPGAGGQVRHQRSARPHGGPRHGWRR